MARAMTVGRCSLPQHSYSICSLAWCENDAYTKGRIVRVLKCGLSACFILGDGKTGHDDIQSVHVDCHLYYTPHNGKWTEKLKAEEQNFQAG